jgi:hypothetical protein
MDDLWRSTGDDHDQTTAVAATTGAGVRIGVVVAADEEHGLLVRPLSSSDAPPIPARSIVAIGNGDVGRQVVLAFDGGDPDLPIVLGLLQPTGPLPASDALPSVASVRQPSPLRVEVQGERLELAGAREIVLRCGQSSITLHASGRIVIKGTEIVSRARGRHRIQGATVSIN